MQKKVLTFFIFILFLGFIFLFFINETNKMSQYNDAFKCFNTDLSVTIYNTNKDDSDKILKEVKNIYLKYDKLLNRNKKFKNINNLYYITYNDSEDENIILDKELYDVIKYYKDWYYKSNGLIDISQGNIYDIWSMYNDSESGFPKKEELDIANTENIDSIILLENNMIKNNHVNINLDYVKKSYVTQIVIDYLKSKNVNSYKITMDNNTFLGDYYKNNGFYKVMTLNPINSDYLIINGNNININTRMISDNSYEYDGKIYNDLINPITLGQINKIKGIVIVTDNIKDSDLMSLMLYSMKIKDGIKYAKENNIEAIWYSNNNKIIKSDNIEKYIVDKEE